MKYPKGPPQTIWLCRGTDGPYLRETSTIEGARWNRTSHTWARKHPDEVLWLSPYCGNCCHTRFHDALFCQGENPFEPCDIWAWSNGTWECNRGATPYRKGEETA